MLIWVPGERTARFAARPAAPAVPSPARPCEQNRVSRTGLLYFSGRGRGGGGEGRGGRGVSMKAAAEAAAKPNMKLRGR